MPEASHIWTHPPAHPQKQYSTEQHQTTMPARIKISQNLQQFYPKVSERVSGFCKRIYFYTATNNKISGATISVQGAKGSYTTTKSGAYFLQLSSGPTPFPQMYPDTNRKPDCGCKFTNTTTQNIGLTVAPKQRAFPVR